jgi:hypothetical protein
VTELANIDIEGLILDHLDGHVHLTQYYTQTHDEARTKSPSWHYADHGDGRDVEPEPQSSAPSIMINVSGSVISKHDLRDATNKQLFGDYARLTSHFRG